MRRVESVADVAEIKSGPRVGPPVAVSPSQNEAGIEARLAALEGELAEERARTKALEARVARVEKTFPSERLTDPAELTLFRVIDESIRGRPWTTNHVCELARTDEPLRDALEAADITNPRELGWLCRRVEREPLHEDLRLERIGDSRDGVLWRLRVLQRETRVP